MQCVPHLGASAGAPLRLPAHAVVGRRAGQPPDRSGVGAAASRPAGTSGGWTTSRSSPRRLPGGGPGERRLDRHHPQAAVAGCSRRRSPTCRPRRWRGPWSWRTSRRWRRSARASDAIVEDPATAEALKPYYRQFCKRPCFHDEYLQTFNRPNVTLVDTQGRGVERITKKGVVVDGRGVRARLPDLRDRLRGRAPTTRAAPATRSIGRDGLDPDGEVGATASARFHGIHIHGFPNCFMMSIAQSGFTVNFPYMIDEQAKHIAYIIERALARGHPVARGDGRGRGGVGRAVVRSRADRTARVRRAVHAGLLQQRGPARTRPGARTASTSADPTEFVEILERWRADGRMPGLERARDPLRPARSDEAESEVS